MWESVGMHPREQHSESTTRGQSFLDATSYVGSTEHAHPVPPLQSSSITTPSSTLDNGRQRTAVGATRTPPPPPPPSILLPARSSNTKEDALEVESEPEKAGRKPKKPAKQVRVLSAPSQPKKAHSAVDLLCTPPIAASEVVDKQEPSVVLPPPAVDLAPIPADSTSTNEGNLEKITAARKWRASLPDNFAANVNIARSPSNDQLAQQGPSMDRESPDDEAYQNRPPVPHQLAQFGTQNSNSKTTYDVETKDQEDMDFLSSRMSLAPRDILEVELAALMEMQENITGRRLQVQEKRKKLRHMRFKVSEADRIFMDALRVCWTTGNTIETDSLRILYDKCNAARDEIGPAEDEYERLELHLSAAEFALAEKFQHLKEHEPLGEHTEPKADHSDEESVFSFESASAEEEILDPRDVSTLHGVRLGGNVPVGHMPSASPLSPPSNVHGLAGVSTQPSLAYLRNPGPRSTVFTEDRFRPVAENGLLGLLDNDAPDLLASRSWGPLDPVSSDRKKKAVSHSPSEDEFELSLNSSENEFTPLYQSKLHLRGLEMNSEPLKPGTDELNNYLQTFDNTLNRVDRWLLHRLRTSPWEIFQLRHALESLSEPENVSAFPGLEDLLSSWPELSLNLWEKDIDPESRDRTRENLLRTDSISRGSDFVPEYSGEKNLVPEHPEPVVDQRGVRPLAGYRDPLMPPNDPSSIASFEKPGAHAFLGSDAF